VSLLDAISVPSGPSAYAEPFDPHSALKMPANALVNAAYLLVAAFWIFWALRRTPDDPHHRVRLRFLAFALLGAAYGPIQFWRIVTQDPLPAVLDQWITLPFFGAFIAWALELLRPASRPAIRAALILAASIASYALAFALPDGFVLALSVHLAAAVALGVALLKRAPQMLWPPFVAALACCAAFVVLKEADFALAAYAPFQRLTGHFWSKLGDAGQFFFALELFRRAHRAIPARSA
jgi:hypothetical protein